MPLKNSEPEVAVSKVCSAENNYGREPLTFIQRCKLKLLLALAWLIRSTGYRGIYSLSSWISFFIWHLLPERRELAIAAIKVHLNKTDEEAKAIARKSFVSNVMSFAEMVKVKDFMRDNSNLLPLPQEYLELESSSRPVVAVLGHFGGWELEGGLLSQFKPGFPQIVVVRNQRSNVLNTFVHKMRSVGTARSIGHRNASSEVMTTLRSNGTAAFLVDHNSSRDEAIFLPFLGEVAAVNVGPAMLALRGKALVCPIFLLRLRNDVTHAIEYRMEVLPHLDTTLLKGSISERVEEIAKFYTNAVEVMVKKYPEQWFWMHNRWKTKQFN